MTLKGFIKLFITGSLIALLIGCQTTRRTLNFETSADLNFTAHSNVNPDQDDRPSPIVIRVLKLGDVRQFKREDFLNLYEDAGNRLGKDLIDTVILKELAPGESRTEHLTLTPDVRYLGLLAEYVQYQRANPILVVPIQDHSSNAFDIDIERLSLVNVE